MVSPVHLSSVTLVHPTQYFYGIWYSGHPLTSTENFTEILSENDVVAKQLLAPPRFQNLLLIVYDHIKTICAIIQRLFGQNKLITRFDGRRCIDE